MRTYVIRRLLLVIPTVILTTFILFFSMRLLPGDVVSAIIASAGPEAEDFDRAGVERSLGLDKPLITQYGRWVGVVPQTDGKLRGLLQGDLGISWWRKTSVLKLVSLKWPVTLELGLMGIILAQLIALPIGIYSAIRQNTWGDYIGRSFAMLCISLPGFWLGTMIIVFPSIWWGYMPSIMPISFLEDPLGNIKMFVVPALVLGMALCGMTMRMARTMMLEVLRQDYVRTAWAKGLRERVVVIRHALRNALIPVITIIGLQMSVLLGGTVIIEQIFVLPGMGRLIINGVVQRDYPLVTGVMFLFVFILLLVNLVVDLAYAFLNPRIHYQ